MEEPKEGFIPQIVSLCMCFIIFGTFSSPKIVGLQLEPKISLFYVGQHPWAVFHPTTLVQPKSEFAPLESSCSECCLLQIASGLPDDQMDSPLVYYRGTFYL